LRVYTRGGFANPVLSRTLNIPTSVFPFPILKLTTNVQKIPYNRENNLEATEKGETIKELYDDKFRNKFITEIVIRKSLNDYIQTAKKYMKDKFFPYHPSTNNCQDFILQMLKANGINDENAFNFVKQDTTMIFKNKGYLSSLAKGVTDLGGYADVVLQGGSIKGNALTNKEIDELVKHYKIKNYNGCYIDSDVRKINNGFTVINLNGNSHWTVLLKSGKKYYYFDSFGFPASQELEDMMKEYVYSDIDLQHINSTSCGFFCIVWMRYMQEHKNKELGFLIF
jgi:hypothetical protein